MTGSRPPRPDDTAPNPKGTHLVRRFKLQVQTTVDGYMAGPNGELDWTTFPWTDDISAYIDALTQAVDTIVLGRKLAEGFIPAWKAGPEGEDQASIDWMNNTPKVVISNSLTESPWENAVVAGGDLAETVNKLKAQPGGDIIAYGGGTLVRDLIANHLLDELHLFVNPIAIGTGMPVFPSGAYQRLRLVTAQPFACGITALHLEPKRS
jgi:dihydrofolate reductase